MKNILFGLSVFTLIFFASCGSNDDMQGSTCETTLAAGTIDGIEYVFGTGSAELENDGTVSIRMNNQLDDITDPCASNGETVEIFGTLPSSEVGRVELFLDLVSFEGQTLTMFNRDGFSNIIAPEGFIEFTSVTESTIEGFMNINDGISPSVDNICGTFTLTICQ